MKKSSSLFLLLISLFLTYSCGTKPRETPVVISHDQEVEFYQTMWTLKRHETESWNITMDNFNEINVDSRYTKDGSINDSLATFLDSLILKHVALIDSSLGVVAVTNEIDMQIHLVRSMEDYLKQSKKFWDGIMRKRVEFLHIGIKNLTDKQQMVLESYYNESGKVIYLNDKIEYALEDFMDKHKITSDDLSK